jgi:hypothetical protein
MATTGRESPTGAADEGIRAPAQRGDTNVPGAAGVEVPDGTSGNALTIRVAPTITMGTAAQPPERTKMGKDSGAIAQRF